MITGMTCANCSAFVERTLNKMPEVIQANVNLATEKAAVTFEDSITTDDLIAAVEKAGYGASVWEETKIDQQQDNKQKELKHARNQLILSIILTAPLILGIECCWDCQFVHRFFA